MKRAYIYVFLAAAALFLLSCQRHEPEKTEPLLSFSATAEDAHEVRSGAGSEKTDGTNLTESPFGVYGIYTPTGQEEEGTNVFLSSSAMEVTHNGADWTYSPTAYWSINQFYRFRAFHPFSGEAFTVNPVSDANRLLIEYKIASGQADLLVGFKPVEATIDNIQKKVQIEFRHALCGLQFKIAFEDSEDIEDGYTDEITMFHLHGFIPTGTLVYGHQDGNYNSEELRWIATYYDDSEYYEWTGLKSFGKHNGKKNDEGSNAVSIFDDLDGSGEGIVFAIPQTISSAPEKPTSVHFKTSRGGSAIHEAVLPKHTWEPGNIYTYTLLIKKSDIKVMLSIKEWNEIQSNENIYI